MNTDPNFPSGLDIKPSINEGVGNTSYTVDERFGTAAQRDAIEIYGIAGRVWEASYAILSYLDRPRANDEDDLEFDPPPFTRANSTTPITIIELGSGTGLIASRLEKYLRPGEDLFITTDLPEVCPLLQSNLHQCPNVRVCPLSWGSHDDATAIASSLSLAHSPPENSGSTHLVTHIICSDLVYFPALLAPLLRTLLHITSSPFLSPAGEPPLLVISYKIRSLSKETPFWSAFGLWFSFSPVLARKRPSKEIAATDETGLWNCFAPSTEDDKTFIFVARRRAESSRWAIPEEDVDLLGGVGAYGTSTHKSDDTFETMLLMSLAGLDLDET